MRVCLLLLALAASSISAHQELPTFLSKIAALPKDQMLEALRDVFLSGGRNSIDDGIIKFLEDFRKSMTAPNPNLGLPTLDPFSIAHADLPIDEAFGKFELILDNTEVRGLSGFVINNIATNVLMLQGNFGFGVPLIAINGTYDIDGVIEDLLPIYGNGPFDVEIYGLNVSGSVKIGSINGSVYIKELPLAFTIDGFHAYLSNLLGGGDFGENMNQIINDMLPELAVTYEEAIATMGSDLIINFANEKLANYTVSDLIDLITGGGGGNSTDNTPVLLL